MASLPFRWLRVGPAVTVSHRDAPGRVWPIATLNGGKTWTNVSGSLPDAPANSSVVWHGKLVVSTEVGIFATSYSRPGNWVRVGRGQPAAPSVDLNVSRDQGYLLVATHGQGLWKIG